MTLEEWQRRLVDEYRGLFQKMLDLDAFMKTELFGIQDAATRVVMKAQFDYMGKYLECLEARIEDMGLQRIIHPHEWVESANANKCR